MKETNSQIPNKSIQKKKKGKEKRSTQPGNNKKLRRKSEALPVKDVAS